MLKEPQAVPSSFSKGQFSCHFFQIGTAIAERLMHPELALRLATLQRTSKDMMSHDLQHRLHSAFERAKVTPALLELSEQVLREIQYYDRYRKNWVPPQTGPDGRRVWDAFIVGAGQSGLGAHFGLEMQGVRHVSIIDSNPPNLEGTWTNYKRMTSLRTPKDLTGLDFGIPALTFQAFYIACYSQEAWEDVHWVDRLDWADYLRWYREILNIPIRYQTKLLAIEPEAGLLKLTLTTQEDVQIEYTHTLVLALGFMLNGVEEIPDELCNALPKRYYAHSSEAIDFATLKGKQVGVLGHAAGALDAAGEALIHGAAEVHVCFRRKELPQVNPLRWFEFPGFLGGFSKLDAATRFQFIRRFKERHQPPTQNSYWRCIEHANFFLHPNANWQSLEEVDEQVEVITEQSVHSFDFLIFGTGKKDPGQLPSLLRPFSNNIARWKNQYAAGKELPAGPPAHFPYMTDHYQYEEKTPGSAPFLKNIFHFNGVAGMRNGPSLTSISGLRYSLPKLVDGVRDQLFLKHVDTLFEEYEAYDQKELDPDLPIPEQWPRSHHT